MITWACVSLIKAHINKGGDAGDWLFLFLISAIIDLMIVFSVAAGWTTGHC